MAESPILKLPTEIHLEIFDDLATADLKSLRLTHPSFLRSTSARLFHNLVIDFKGTWNEKKEITEYPLLTPKITSSLLSDDCTIPWDEMATLSLSVSIEPWGVGADDFHDFSSNALLPLLSLVKEVKTLKLRSSNYFIENSSATESDVKANGALDIFHGGVKRAFENGLEVENLDIRCVERNVSCLTPLRCLRSLTLHVKEDHFGDYSCRYGGKQGLVVAAAMFKIVAGVMVDNKSMAEVDFDYFYPHVKPLLTDGKEIADLVLDEVTSADDIKHIKKLTWGRTVQCTHRVENVKKLRNLEYLKIHPNTDRDYDQKKHWKALKDAEVRLKYIKTGYTDAITDEFLDYAEYAGSGITHFTLPGYQHESRNRSQDHADYRARLTQRVMPSMFATLVRLTLSVDVQVEQALPEILCPLLKPHAGARTHPDTWGGVMYTWSPEDVEDPDESNWLPSPTFSALMDILEKCVKLEKVVAHIGTGDFVDHKGHDTWKMRLIVPWNREEREGWKGRGMEWVWKTEGHAKFGGPYKYRSIFRMVDGKWEFVRDRDMYEGMHDRMRW